MGIVTQITLWLVVFLLFAMVLSLCVFYAKKLLENRQVGKLNEQIDLTFTSIQQRQKIKAEILLDLEKKLEAL